MHWRACCSLDGQQHRWVADIKQPELSLKQMTASCAPRCRMFIHVCSSVLAVCCFCHAASNPQALASFEDVAASLAATSICRGVNKAESSSALQQQRLELAYTAGNSCIHVPPRCAGVGLEILNASFVLYLSTNMETPHVECR
jgi:hypothetical protein